MKFIRQKFTGYLVKSFFLVEMKHQRQFSYPVGLIMNACIRELKGLPFIYWTEQ